MAGSTSLYVVYVETRGGHADQTGQANEERCPDVLYESTSTDARPDNRAEQRKALPPTMRIQVDDLTGPQIRALLEEHLRTARELSPPQSVHAMDVDRLRRPDITFWTLWSGDELWGCGALRELTAQHGEVKSMRTALTHRRKGVGRALLAHIVQEAQRRSYARLSLETGSNRAYEPAQKLYESMGFSRCGPFGEYRDDPHKVFMTRLV